MGVENILLLVKSVDGGLGLLSGREGDETESTGATSLTVNHDDLEERKRLVSLLEAKIENFWIFHVQSRQFGRTHRRPRAATRRWCAMKGFWDSQYQVSLQHED